MHSDQEKSILGGELSNYIQQKGWWQTSTEGYDSNGNSRVEGRNTQVRALLHAAMVTATGGNSYSQDIWDEMVMHGSNTILLNTPYAGKNMDLRIHMCLEPNAYTTNRKKGG